MKTLYRKQIRLSSKMPVPSFLAAHFEIETERWPCSNLCPLVATGVYCNVGTDKFRDKYWTGWSPCYRKFNVPLDDAMRQLFEAYKEKR